MTGLALTGYIVPDFHRITVWDHPSSRRSRMASWRFMNFNQPDEKVVLSPGISHHHRFK